VCIPAANAEDIISAEADPASMAKTIILFIILELFMYI
jgi:hypothetical protein